MSMIQPEPVVLDIPGYTPDRWDYPARCADVDTALEVIREQIQEWDQVTDPHGWWHYRPRLIALYNEVLRLQQPPHPSGSGDASTGPRSLAREASSRASERTGPVKAPRPATGGLCDG
jgi:hypothetical protein